MMAMDHHSLADRDFLRTKTTAQLKKLHRNTERSRGELTRYIEAITDVLVERAKEEAGATTQAPHP